MSRTEDAHPQFQVINCTGRLVADPHPQRAPPQRRQRFCEMCIAVDGMGRGGRDQTAGYIDVHSHPASPAPKLPPAPTDLFLHARVAWLQTSQLARTLASALANSLTSVLAVRRA